MTWWDSGTVARVSNVGNVGNMGGQCRDHDLYRNNASVASYLFLRFGRSTDADTDGDASRIVRPRRLNLDYH